MTAKKVFSRIGLAMFLLVIVSNVVSLVISVGLNFLPFGILDSYEITEISSFLALDVTGLFVFWIVIRKLPKFRLEKSKLSFGNFVVFFLISFAIAFLGNIVGTVISDFFSGGTATNFADELMQNASVFTWFDVVIIAPICEEIINRKLIIDRTVQFGEKYAVVFSATMFGLMHGNFFQFFYAFGVGLILGYVYVRYGKLKYTILIHMVFNFICGVLPTVFAADEQSMMAAFYGAFDILLVIIGIILLVKRRKSLYFRETLYQLNGHAISTMYLNVGFILFFIASLAEFIIALF